MLCESTGLSTKERKAKRCIVIKDFNDELLNLVMILDQIENIWLINEQQQIEIDQLYDRIWKFDEPIKNLEILLEKKNVECSFAEEEIELIEATKEKISELQAELECKQDLINQDESESFEIFSDLYDQRMEALYELYLKEIKLEKLGVLKTKIDKDKESNNLDRLILVG